MQRPSVRSLALAAGLVAAAGAVVPVVGDARPTAAKQVITFQEPRPRVAQNDLAPRSSSKLSLGDRLTIGGLLENTRHQRLGTFGGTCFAVSSGGFDTTPLMCHAVYKVAGGQIVAMGMMTLSRTSLVIIGGSGAYDGVHGTVSPGKAAKGFEDADRLTIER